MNFQCYNFKKRNAGFSTLEMLMAMFVLILTITGVIMVAFGSQSMLVDGQTQAEALGRAQAALELAQARARQDFRLVNPAVSDDGFYRTELDAVQQPDFFTKLVTAAVVWSGQAGQSKKVELKALVTDFNNAVGGDTCDSALSPDADAWKSPAVKASFGSLSGFPGMVLPHDIYPITDIDAYKSRLYVAANNSAATSSAPAIFVFDISAPAAITPIPYDFVDNDPANSSGVNALAAADFADGAGNKKIYLFAANASGLSAGQLQVYQVAENGADTVPPVLKASLAVTAAGVGNSIFYRDGYVYLGLKSVGGGPEFHIINVRDPEHPQLIAGGTYAVGNDINAIYVRNGYAYLATPNSRELTVLDVRDLSAVKTGAPPWGFDAPGGGNGKSLYAAGDALYLGRTIPSTGPEFYVLDNRDPKDIPANNATTTSIAVGDSVDALAVRSGLGGSPAAARNLAFLLTRSRFEVWDLASLAPWTPAAQTSEFLALPVSGSSVFEPVMDCEGNRFYAAANDGSDDGSLFLIYP